MSATPVATAVHAARIASDTHGDQVAVFAGTPIVESWELVAGSHAASDRPKGRAGTAIASTRNH